MYVCVFIYISMKYRIPWEKRFCILDDQSKTHIGIMTLICINSKSPYVINKQRVLMHRHQGWNVRHGLCHIYMRYLYIYELFIAFVCFVVCSLLQRDGIFGVLCRKWQARESTGMFGNLMAIYYIMPQFIQNHSRFVMLMKTCMIS